jgi:hypothetical protein
VDAGDQRHRRREQAERRHDGDLGDGHEREDELDEDEEPGDPQAVTGVHAGRVTRPGEGAAVRRRWKSRPLREPPVAGR